jgi:hypothetical protein
MRTMHVEATRFARDFLDACTVIRRFAVHAHRAGAIQTNVHIESSGYTSGHLETT